MTTEFEREKARVQRDILRLFDLKPWQAGLKPAPRRVRLLGAIRRRFARWSR